MKCHVNLLFVKQKPGKKEEKTIAFISRVPIKSDDCISSTLDNLRPASIRSSCNLAPSHSEAGGDAEPIMSVSLQVEKLPIVMFGLSFKTNNTSRR